MAFFKKDKFRNNSSKGKSFQQPQDSFRGNRRDRARARESSDRFRQNQTFFGHEQQPFSKHKPTRKEETQAICARCGKSCTLPFRPTAGKPVYCSDCFRKDDYKQRSAPTFSNSNSNISLEEINHKLEKIMRALKIQ
jgi:CxxC-x17-CxxC domain-containing protein